MKVSYFVFNLKVYYYEYELTMNLLKSELITEVWKRYEITMDKGLSIRMKSFLWLIKRIHVSDREIILYLLMHGNYISNRT